jgi:hypothetical protein
MRRRELELLASVLDKPVVIDTSGLAIMGLVPELWALALASFSSVTVPIGVVQDVIHGRDEIARPSDAALSWDASSERMVYRPTPQPIQAEWRRRADWMQDELGRLPVYDREDLRHFPQADYARQASWLASVDCAVEQKLGLLIDDLGTRLIAQSMGVAAFGTATFLEVMVQRGRVPDGAPLTNRLRDANCCDLPFDVSDMARQAEADGWQPGVAWLQLTRPAFWADGTAGQLLLAVCEGIPRDRGDLLALWLDAAVEGACRMLPDQKRTDACALLVADVVRRFGERSTVPALLDQGRSTSTRLGGGDPLPAVGRMVREQLGQTVDPTSMSVVVTHWLADVSDDARHAFMTGYLT